MRGHGVQARGGEHRFGRYVDELGVGHVAVALDERLLHGLHHQVVVVRAALGDAGEVESIEDAEDLERGHALRGRRQAQQLAATIGHAQRQRVARGGTRQVRHAQRRAHGAQAGDDALGQLAFIELARAMAGDAFEAAAQRRLAQCRADGRDRTIGHEGLCEAGPAAQLIGPEVLPEMLRWRDREALVRVGDGAAEQRGPVLPAAPGVAADGEGAVPGIDRGGGGQRGARAARGNRLAKRRQRLRGLADAGQRAHVARAVADEPEGVAAQPREVRIGDGQRGADGDGGFDGGAAIAQDLETRLAGERMRAGDHAPAGMGEIGGEGGGMRVWRHRGFNVLPDRPAPAPGRARVRRPGRWPRRGLPPAHRRGPPATARARPSGRPAGW